MLDIVCNRFVSFGRFSTLPVHSYLVKAMEVVITFPIFRHFVLQSCSESSVFVAPFTAVARIESKHVEGSQVGILYPCLSKRKKNPHLTCGMYILSSFG